MTIPLKEKKKDEDHQAQVHSKTFCTEIEIL